MLQRLAKRALLAMCFSLCLQTTTYASGFPGDAGMLWNDALIVVRGTPEGVGSLHEAMHQHRRVYRLRVEEWYKGGSTRHAVEIVDPHFHTSAQRPVQEGQSCVVFLGLKKGSESLTLEFLWGFPIAGGNLEELEAAFEIFRAYDLLKSEDRKAFLLRHLEIPNRYSHSMIVREILHARITEALPYFQRQLREATSEQQKLNMLSNAATLGDPNVTATLRGWLNDDAFKNKVDVIHAMVRSVRDKSLVEDVRQHVSTDSDRLNAAARGALLRWGEPDAKGLLFDLIDTSNDSIARRNAMHVLRHEYSGDFTEEEKRKIHLLCQDEDESVARNALQLVEQWQSTPESEAP